MIAVFEGWLQADRRTAMARGPFTVEVFEDLKRSAGHFRARILPTKILFFETAKVGASVPIDRKTAGEVQRIIETMFEKKLTDWHDPASGGRPQDFSHGTK